MQLQSILEANKRGEQKGIFSVCSANPFVLKTAMKEAKKKGYQLLIESTSNQVNQYGGYTGMRPTDFCQFVNGFASESGLAENQIILGGDHLGPNCWRDKNETSAMDKAKVQIAEYVQAGYAKIHLDASMPLGSETQDSIGIGIIATRTAELCKVAEENIKSGIKPIYIIGADVPIPGGAFEDLDQIETTPVEEIQETICLTKKAFEANNLHEAWERVVGIVVQPGVEFSEKIVIPYDQTRAQSLVNFIKDESKLVFEAHSTDYQLESCLSQMVHDHFAILKVGPELTFALREALFGMACIESELYGSQKSNIIEIVEKEMLVNPKHWQSHYHGSDKEKHIARLYALSDRIRYYWPEKMVVEAVQKLLHHFKHISSFPLGLLKQFMPQEYEAFREGALPLSPTDLVEYKIKHVICKYEKAVGVN